MMTRYLACVGALALPACMPLEQAPLVYSSKQQIGVGLGVGESATPTLDVNIGYKGHDMALVPVFVAKPCPKDRACDTKYDLRPILGENKVTSKSQQQKDDIDRLVQAIAAKDGELAAANTLIAAKRDDLALIDGRGDLEALGRTIEAIPLTAPATTDTTAGETTPVEIANVDGPSPAPRAIRTTDQSKQLDTIKAKLRKIGQLKKTDIEASITDIEKKKAKLADDRLTEQTELDRLRASRDDSADDAKIDALSVYGSFNGDASGGRDGAGLKLGKVFSTGVAAQNLSQGIGAGARASASADCYRAAIATIEARKPSDDKRDRMWDDALRHCGIRDW